MFVWMKVTRDKYELPIAVADSASELAKMCGVSEQSVLSAICRKKAGKLKKTTYFKIEIETMNEKRKRKTFGYAAAS